MSHRQPANTASVRPRNDSTDGHAYAPPMQTIPTSRKEPTMKTTATQKLIRLAAAAAPAITLAATSGHMSWSDANLKQEIQPVEGALAAIRSI
jgi:hypothetical protein